MLDVQELEILLKSHGWYLNWTKRYNTRYLHAKRRVGAKLQTKYLVSENKIAELTSEEVVRRLNSVQESN